MSNVIKIGNLTIDSFKVGAADCSIYLGTTKLYPQGEPPTPVGFKYILTLNNGDIVSAETDGTSAITQAEISAYSQTCVAAEFGNCVTIGDYAFDSFSSLSSVTFGSGVTTTIGDGAFGYCTNLINVAIPDSVEEIGLEAFAGCTNLSSVTLGSGVTIINAYAFNGCTSLTNIDVPDSVATINAAVFMNCRSLISANIGSGVTFINNKVFFQCSGLTGVTIEATSPPQLGSDVFYRTNSCPIYVPCESVELYKQASGWSSYSSRITCIPTPTYQWVSYTTGDTVPTATTVYGVKLYMNYDESYNIIFSGTTGDYIKFHPNGDFGQWSAEDENGNSISISSYFIPGSMMYTIEFSDLGLGGMNIISPATFEDDIDLYVTN